MECGFHGLRELGYTAQEGDFSFFFFFPFENCSFYTSHPTPSHSDPTPSYGWSWNGRKRRLRGAIRRIPHHCKKCRWTQITGVPGGSGGPPTSNAPTVQMIHINEVPNAAASRCSGRFCCSNLALMPGRAGLSAVPLNAFVIQTAVNFLELEESSNEADFTFFYSTMYAQDLTGLTTKGLGEALHITCLLDSDCWTPPGLMPLLVMPPPSNERTSLGFRALLPVDLQVNLLT